MVNHKKNLVIPLVILYELEEITKKINYERKSTILKYFNNLLVSCF